MFGGAGLFHGPAMFGIVDDDAVYLKASAESQAAFVAAGAAPFTYSTKNGRRSLKTYMSLPEGILDEPDVFLEWAKRAMIDADARAKTSKPKAPKLKRLGKTTRRKPHSR
jgi:DNA transformation protein